MDKFTAIHIFMTFLKRAKYKNKKAFEQDDFEKTLAVLEKDRDKIFQIFYGDHKITRGKTTVKESDYRFAEALVDLKNHYISSSMHYLLTQIKIGDLKL